MAETRIHELSLGERDRRWRAIRAKGLISRLPPRPIKAFAREWNTGPNGAHKRLKKRRFHSANGAGRGRQGLRSQFESWGQSQFRIRSNAVSGADTG